MTPSFCRGSRWIVMALAAAAFLAPTAQAHHAPAGQAATPPSSSDPTWSASGHEIDRLGPKYVPLQHAIGPATVTLVKAVKPSGFDWADAGVGAAAASLTLALVAVLAMLIARRNRDDAPRAELAAPR